jgi:protocatechuate 4,5-dioxygenase, alpha chain
LQVEQTDRRYRSIEGTYVQDSAHTRRGYRLNQFLMTLNRAEGREVFRADEERCLDEWRLTDDQREAVIRRDWLRLIRLGGNIFFVLKLAAFDGVSVQQVCAQMAGVDEVTYRTMMLAGGRRPADMTVTDEV